MPVAFFSDFFLLDRCFAYALIDALVYRLEGVGTYVSVYGGALVDPDAP